MKSRAISALFFCANFSNQYQLVPNSRCKDKKLAFVLATKIKRYQMKDESRNFFL